MSRTPAHVLALSLATLVGLGVPTASFGSALLLASFLTGWSAITWAEVPPGCASDPSADEPPFDASGRFDRARHREQMAARAAAVHACTAEWEAAHARPWTPSGFSMRKCGGFCGL